MALNAKVFTALLHIFACLFLDILEISNGSQGNMDCLKSIKNSLEDPHRYLKDSWDFSNNTEGFVWKFYGINCCHPDGNEVLSIQLSNRGLRGQFPRGIKNCSSLTRLNLSSNELLGPLPLDIAKLVLFVSSLDLVSIWLSLV